MSNAGKRKGTAWESAVRDYLREAGCDVEVLRQLGSVDEGDLVVRSPGGLRFVLEAKNRAKVSLPEFLGEAVCECALYAHNRGIDSGRVFPAAVVKARGKPASEGWFVMRLEDARDLIQGV